MNLYSILEEMITWFDAQHYEPCYAVDDCPFRYDYDGAIEAGASKIVFVPNEGEYVYKVSSNYVEGDYCYREERNYRLAKECGVDEFFIATEYFATIADHDVYIQKKVDIASQERITTKANKEIGKDYCANDFGFYSIFDTWCVGALVTQYGIDRVEALLDFAKKYNVNDLAEYNSCLENGVIKFFDYAGYDED